MADPIIFVGDSIGVIHIRDLIAFFPSFSRNELGEIEGYMIFQGYSRVKGVKLPYKATFYRSVNDKIAVFNINITEVNFKDVQPVVSKDKEPHYCDPDECGCCIQFSPSDIIIIKFTTIDIFFDRHNNGVITDKELGYCIDDRFSTYKELIERYKSLLELPDDPYEPYDIVESDREFYEGYHKILLNRDNLYSEI